MPFSDSYARPIEYLRVSVTDRCNLRCRYCMPEEGIIPIAHDAVLRYEEIVRIVRVAVSMGLAAGEPLVRRGIVDLVAQLAAIPGLEDLSMTTNGMLLERYAGELAQAGLRRINLSLDTLRPERFHNITRLGSLEQVLRGREAALEAGLRPVKVNTVVVRGSNDDEIVDLARLTLLPDWHVRFIEVMPLGTGEHWSEDGVVPTTEIRARVEAGLGPLISVPNETGVGPARYYQLPGAAGTLGFISPVSEHFCHACNRLRLTSDGLLLPCLMSDRSIDLRTPLRTGASDSELREIFQKAILAKPRGHQLAEHQLPECLLPMSTIGG
ncbi:MAG: Cyclic pyranopterin monophosphate synthase [Chloroflexi bacterium ADurb.Bin360]|nr:MAG: Cyclic pyranopterin monophosphate synthase [Chloroflexi bacterium ADurb.Bin360]